MRVFNRIVMVIAIVLGIAGALLLALYPLEMVKFVRANVDLFEEALFNDRSYLFFLIAVAVWVVVLLVLLVLELHRARKKAVRIRTKSGANAMLGVDSVVQSLEYRIDELAGVRKVAPHIRSRGKDVEVSVDLDTSPSVNIPVLTDQVVELCRDIVEGQLGVKIHGKVAINVHHEPYPRGTMPPTQPTPKGTEAIATQPRMIEQAPEPLPVEPDEQPRPAREPRFRRRVREASPTVQPESVAAPRPAPVPSPEPAPAPAIEAEPLVFAPSTPGPAPLGDLTPLKPSSEDSARESEALDELDDLDLYDPDARDE
jgi:hypothetical protein